MEKTTKTRKILLSGGGTGGSVSPLLAVAEALKKKGNFEFLFVGTANGPEKDMVAKAGLPFQAILAGKLRRYFDWHNFIDILKIKLAFWQSLFLLIKNKPDLVITAGSFVAVPLVWAAACLRIPCLVHQMDIRPGLANLLMAPFAKLITVTFEKSLDDYGARAVWTGNPSQLLIINYQLSISDARKFFNLKDALPTVFVVGGGTGAVAINKLIEDNIAELTSFCQIIHSTGKGKMTSVVNDNYHVFEFLNAEEMAKALLVCNLVITRAGIGSLTDLAAFKKPAIIIPMPKTHQEENAQYFAQKGAGVYLKQLELNNEKFVATVKDFLFDDEGMMNRASENVAKIMKEGAAEKVADLALKICQK
jgi:UDP-N-acetylglucosamine--N-acetylmuramyl-(pentapeptide) pyrophosphoryl-undecaprenol N-acetylglucosamine transferase